MQETSDISSTADGMFFGCIFSAILLGITVVHSWTYIHNNNDKWPMRTFVIVLILLDVAETWCNIQLLHHYTIKNFGDLNVLRTFSRLIFADIAMAGAIMFLVHIFFASRLFLLGTNWLYPGFIVFSSIAMLGLSILSIVLQLLHRLRGPRFLVYMIVFHALGIFIDILVTIGLCMKVLPGRAQFKQTKMIFHQLLMYSITRGILITLVQISHVIMYLAKPSQLLFWMSMHFIVGKLYVITTLVILNTRASRQQKLDDVVMLDSLPLSFAKPHLALDTHDDVEANPHLNHVQ